MLQFFLVVELKAELAALELSRPPKTKNSGRFHTVYMDDYCHPPTIPIYQTRKKESLSLDSSGVFKAPPDGLYAFHLIGHKNVDGDSSEMDWQLNEKVSGTREPFGNMESSLEAAIRLNSVGDDGFRVGVLLSPDEKIRRSLVARNLEDHLDYNL